MSDRGSPLHILVESHHDVYVVVNIILSSMLNIYKFGSFIFVYPSNPGGESDGEHRILKPRRKPLFYLRIIVLAALSLVTWPIQAWV